MATLNSTSRYLLTEQRLDDLVSPGRLRFGHWKVPDIDLTGYSRYVVTEADQQRIDLISYKMYDDARYWWVLAIVNDIANPLADIPVGQVLIIPTLDAVSEALAQRKTEN